MPLAFHLGDRKVGALMMKFWNLREVQWAAVWSRGPRRILETSLVQNGGLLKHGDRTPGQEELPPGVVRDGRLCTLWLGEGEGKGGFKMSFHMLKRA